MTVDLLYMYICILTVAETLSQSVTKLLTPSPISAPAALHKKKIHVHVHVQWSPSNPDTLGTQY